MSVKAMSAVWERSRMKGAPLLLLLAIADHANDRGHDAYPSIETLRRKVRMGERSVRRIVRLLEEEGELRTSIGTGPRGTNEYIVVVATGVTPVKLAPGDGVRMAGGQDDPAPVVAVAPGQDGPPAKSCSGGGPNRAGRGAKFDTLGGHSYGPRTIQEPSKEPSLIRPVAAAAADQPRRVLEGEALEEAVVRCIRAWENATGMTVTAQTGDALGSWLEKLPEAALVKAIAETGAMGARSWKYCEAILRRYELEGWEPENDERRAANDEGDLRQRAAANREREWKAGHMREHGCGFACADQEYRKAMVAA